MTVATREAPPEVAPAVPGRRRRWTRRILPARALELGYRFRWTDLRAAMADVLGR